MVPLCFLMLWSRWFYGRKWESAFKELSGLAQNIHAIIVIINVPSRFLEASVFPTSANGPTHRKFPDFQARVLF